MQEPNDIINNKYNVEGKETRLDIIFNEKEESHLQWNDNEESKITNQELLEVT